MFLLLQLALADSADTADTGPYEDNDAKAEAVYTQDDGCGVSKALFLLPLAVLMRRRFRS
jgi:hypothetical protein